MKKIRLGMNRKFNEQGELTCMSVRPTPGTSRRDSLGFLIEDLESYMPGPQLVDARHIPGWFGIAKQRLGGTVHIKRLRRMLPELNPAMVPVKAEGRPIDMRKLKVIKDSEAVPDGQAWVSSDIMRAIRSALAGHHHEVERVAGIPAQARIAKLRDPDAESNAAFWSLMREIDALWHKDVMESKLDDEWIKKHAALPDLGGLFLMAAVMGDTKKAFIHDMFNGWLREKIQTPFRRGQMGRFGRWATISFNDALEDGVGNVVETEEISGCGAAIFKNGEGYKVFVREVKDLDPGSIWVNPKNQVIKGAKKDGFFVIIGTHTKRWIEFNKTTFDLIGPKMDGADMDGDQVLVGEGPSAGLILRMPLSHYQGLVSIIVDLNGIVYPANKAGLSWDVPPILKFEDRPKMQLEINFDLPERVALGMLARQVMDAWNAVKVGPTNLMLQIGTILGWPREELDFLAKMQTYAIDLRRMERDEIRRWHEMHGRIIPFENRAEGRVPALFSYRYPEAQVVVTNTDEDQFMADHLELVRDLQMDFIDGVGEPPIPIDDIVVGEKAKEFFEGFREAFNVHKEEMRVGMATDLDYNAKMERTLFIKTWRELFVASGINAKELVRLHQLNPVPRAWVVDGLNEDGNWAKTADQTLIRIIADWI